MPSSHQATEWQHWISGICTELQNAKEVSMEWVCQNSAFLLFGVGRTMTTTIDHLHTSEIRLTRPCWCKQKLAWPSNLGQATWYPLPKGFTASRAEDCILSPVNGLRSFAGKCWNAKGPTMPLPNPQISPVLPEPFPNAKPWEAAQTLREKPSCTNTELCPFLRYFSYLSFLNNTNVVSENFHQHISHWSANTSLSPELYATFFLQAIVPWFEI